MVNLNHGVLHLGVLPNCHVSMEIKIKHRYYVLDIDKNRSYASIRFSKRPLKSGNESRKVKKRMELTMKWMKPATAIPPSQSL